MSLVVSAGATYTLAPAGLHPCVCCDVVDLGQQQTEHGMRNKVAIIWSLGYDLDDNGKPYEARRVYGASLGEKASLRKDLAAWRGRDFTPAELKSFDLEVLLGVNAQIMITHVVKGDQTYARVTAVVPPPKGAAKIAVPQDYVRRKDRAVTATEPVSEADDSSVPFAWLLPLLVPALTVGSLWL